MDDWVAENPLSNRGSGQPLVVSDRASAPSCQHNQPAAVAVAAVIGSLAVADQMPARLLAVFLANPLGVSVAAVAGSFCGGGGGEIPAGTAAKTPLTTAPVMAIFFNTMLLPSSTMARGLSRRVRVEAGHIIP